MKPLNLSQSSDEPPPPKKVTIKMHKGKDDGRGKSVKAVVTKTEVIKPANSTNGIPAIPSGQKCACGTAKDALLSGPQHPPKLHLTLLSCLVS